MNLQNPQLLRSTNFIAGNWVAADSKATLTGYFKWTKRRFGQGRRLLNPAAPSRRQKPSGRPGAP